MQVGQDQVTLGLVLEDDVGFVLQRRATESRSAEYGSLY